MIQLVLSGMLNRTTGTYFAANNRIDISLITKTDRIQVFIYDLQNRRLVPSIVAMCSILLPSTSDQAAGRCLSVVVDESGPGF
jgi:hypothetical protein